MLGIEIIKHPLAETVKRMPKIERTKVKKRRRGWTLIYHTEREPAAYQIGSTIYVHPAIYDRLVSYIKGQKQ